MTADRPGHAALAQIDQALARRPDKDDHALSHATEHLSALRDGMVAAWRQGGIDAAGRTRLEHVNAVITVVLGVHFPLGDVPWPELEKARAWLADVVGAGGPAS